MWFQLLVVRLLGMRMWVWMGDMRVVLNMMLLLVRVLMVLLLWWWMRWMRLMRLRNDGKGELVVLLNLF